MGFVFNVGEQKKAAAAAKEKSKGSKKSMDLKKELSEVLVLPPTQKDAPIFFETCIHEVWVNKKPIATCASPTFEGEEDPIMKQGWKIREKFQDSKSEKLKNLFKLFMPKNNRYVYVLNKDSIDAGPLLLKLPSAAYDTLMDEINEVETEEDMKAICDLDDGRWLRIKHNGGEGLNKKYVAKFSKNTAQLVEQGLVDADKLAASVPDLRKLQPAVDPAAVKKVLKALMEQANKIIEREGGSMDDEEEEDDVILEDNDSEDDVELDEVETKSTKKPAPKTPAKTPPKGKTPPKKPAKDEEEDEFDLDEEED
jgi:hypothetical protein